MDTSEAVTEVVNRFEGKSFPEVFDTLVHEAPSYAPGCEVMIYGIRQIEALYQALGKEFNPSQYWNESVVEGSHPIIPSDAVFTLECPEVLTVEGLDRMIESVSALESVVNNTRNLRDQPVNAGMAHGTFQARRLDSSVNRIPVYIPVLGSSADDEDDFL